jgi:uncharacterized small protein (DUF1192 family)
MAFMPLSLFWSHNGLQNPPPQWQNGATTQGTRAMDLDDAPKKPANMVIGENLDAISVAELEQRIQALESEIVRLKAEIAKKQASRNAADAFFRN